MAHLIRLSPWRISQCTISDRFYAGMVTQIDEEQLDLPMEEQDHQPLAFLSGEFKGAQLRWTEPEKEGFAIVDTVVKVDYLLLSHDEFSILSYMRVACILLTICLWLPTLRTLVRGHAMTQISQIEHTLN
jgi:hypothetical protein